MIAGVLSVVSLALMYLIPAPPSVITIATAFKGASFDYYGRRYRERLAHSGVKVDLRETAGAVENVKLLQDTNSGVDVAFVNGGVSDGEHAPGLLSLGVVYNIPYWLFYVAPEPLDSLSQFKGKRIAIGPIGSGTRLSAEKILAQTGVNSDTAIFSTFAGNAAVDALASSKVDAVWIIGAPAASAVQSFLRDKRFRLFDFPMAEAFTRILPELIQLKLPRGVVDVNNVIPPTDVTLVGTTTRILVRDTLHPDIVHRLLKTMIDEHNGPEIFQRSREFPMNADPEYPMAASAVDYYKNGPSLLQRYLPLWLTVHVQRLIAVLVTTVAVGLPLFNYVPRLYRWFVRERVLKLYRKLRVLEKEFRNDLSSSDIRVLQENLEGIERATNNLRVPNRFSDLLFSLKVHINLVRTRLGTRSAEARSRDAKQIS